MMKLNEKLNFMGEVFCNDLRNTLMGNNFPWYYNDLVAGDDKGSEFFFTHIIFSSVTKNINSDGYRLIEPILDKLKLDTAKIMRIKLNLYTNQGNLIKHNFHTDFLGPHTTFIYSLNTTNGYFELDDGTRSLDISDKLMEFDGLIPHRGTTTTNEFYRLNMVINYEK